MRLSILGVTLDSDPVAHVGTQFGVPQWETLEKTLYSHIYGTDMALNATYRGTNLTIYQGYLE
jgi:hypothetical protein